MSALKEDLSAQAHPRTGVGLARFASFLNKPADAAPLAYFRFVFGAIMVWEVYRYWSKGWIDRYWVEPDIFFTYTGFGWVQPWPEPFMHVHFAALAILAAAMAIGLAYRLSSALFAVGFCYVFLLDQANYLNHFYLIGLLAIMLAFMPAERFLSVDARLNPAKASRWVPNWAPWLLRFQLTIVYVFGGIAKMNPDWLQGRPMNDWLSGSGAVPVVGSFLESAAAPILMSWSGMLLDLFIVPALLWKRTRIPAVIALALFHLTNSAVFSIGIFPWFMLLATPIFFPTPWRLPRLAALPDKKPAFAISRVGLATILAFGTWQVLMPLRHHLYPGNVSWTEEGHNFSWHMKLRDKSGRVQFRAVDPQTGETWRIDHTEYLSRRQARKMTIRPQMIAQFARKVEPRLRQELGRQDLTIQARASVSLNGRSPRPMIDSDVDLSTVRWRFAASPWVLPLEGEGTAGE